MPTISGSLNLVTDRPVDSISEIWIRARETRGHDGGLVVGVNDRVPDSDGSVEFTALPGAAVLVLMQQGIPLESHNIVVGTKDTQTLWEVVEPAYQWSPEIVSNVRASTAQAQTAANKAAQHEIGAKQAETGAKQARNDTQAIATDAATAIGGVVDDVLNAAQVTENNAQASGQDAQATAADRQAVAQAAQQVSDDAQQVDNDRQIVEDAAQQVSDDATRATQAAARIGTAEQVGTWAQQAGTARDESVDARDAAQQHAANAEAWAQLADPDGWRQEIAQQIADIVDGAPEDLDTFLEIAEYAQGNRDAIDLLNAAIEAKAKKDHTHNVSQVAGAASTSYVDGRIQLVTSLPSSPDPSVLYLVEE